MPPRVGVLWTPGYWGFVSGVYLFHAGYWGPHVGFYGGVNYGGGYVGDGYHGGRWENNHFAYNTSVTNVNTTIVHNTYNETVINNTTVNRVSYNGGAGGVHAVATPADNAAMHERHVAPTQSRRSTSRRHEPGPHPAGERQPGASADRSDPASGRLRCTRSCGRARGRTAPVFDRCSRRQVPAQPLARTAGQPRAVNAAYQPAQPVAPGPQSRPGMPRRDSRTRRSHAYAGSLSHGGTPPTARAGTAVRTVPRTAAPRRE